jgi:DNA-directed RNA polymerase subunit alpha
MMTETRDLTTFFDAPDLDPEAFEHFADGAHVSFSARERFETLVDEYQTRTAQGQGDPLRLALGLLILGQHADALKWFNKAPVSKWRHFYAAQAATGAEQLDTAIEELKLAAKQGWEPLDIDLRLAALALRKGQEAPAEQLIQKHRQEGQDRAEWYFATGLLHEFRLQCEPAIEAFERSLTLAPDHTEATFRCARLYDLCGDDEAALELYRRLSLQPRAHVNALLNAAVVYEDIGRFEEAATCLRRVLRLHPNHNRARLYLKDVESCQQMVIDETGEEKVDARTRLLDTPLSEFELSVRARNCLKKMNIRSLGELVRLSEQELLSYKNFGETSLSEIKALLTKKGLHLGQSPEEIPIEVAEAPIQPARPPLPPGQEAILSKPVAEVELSVRARRCLQRLNVATLADLVAYSEADLLATRNFGVTSLNEVKTRLADYGLQLATRKAD